MNNKNTNYTARMFMHADFSKCNVISNETKLLSFITFRQMVNGISEGSASTKQKVHVKNSHFPAFITQ